MKLALIDRDGVLNEELPNYVKSVNELTILPQAFEALRMLHENEFTCVVVTNQSVVGRGIIEQFTLDKIHKYLLHEIEAQGGKIAEVLVCTDHPSNASYRRKPKPGMLIEALEKYNALPEKSPMIGDALTDMEAAHAAGCPRYLVMTGKGKSVMHSIANSLQPVTVCADILDAAQRIISLY